MGLAVDESLKGEAIDADEHYDIASYQIIFVHISASPCCTIMDGTCQWKVGYFEFVKYYTTVDQK